MRGNLQMDRPQPTKNFYVVAGLLLVSWLSTVIYEPWREIVEGHLLIDKLTAPQLELWAALTHVIFPRDFLMLIFNAVMLYFFAADLERAWGLKKWWGTALAATALGGAATIPVAWAVGSTQVFSGFALPISAFIAAYCWRIWDTRMHFFTIELTGRTMLIFFVCLDALFSLLALDPSIMAGRLVAMACGLVAAEGVSNLRMRFARWRIRRKLSVVKSPESEGKKRDPRKRDDGTWIN